MKKIIKTTALALFMLGSFSAKAYTGDPRKASLAVLREKIGSEISSLVVSISEKEDAENFLVRFEITDKNTLSLVSVEGCDAWVSAQLKKKLQGMKVEGNFDPTDVYDVKIVFKRNEN